MGVGFTISNNLGISKEEGDKIYNSYMTAFPGIKKYFDKVFTEAENNGYVLISNVTGAKSYIDFYEEYLLLRSKIKEKGFWDNYKEHKNKQSFEFKNYYSPTVKQYYKYEGIIRRKSYNYSIQGEAANITKLAAIKFYNYIIQNNLWGKVLLVHLVHDEILAEWPKELDGIEQVLKECLEESANKFCKRIPLTATYAIGDHWIH